MKRSAQPEARATVAEDQWQPQPPPPQQVPPPPEKDGDDFAEAPLAEPLGALKTESCSVFFLLSHFGQAIAWDLLNTIFSKCVWQSSHMYS
jgi:hypothetical protein